MARSPHYSLGRTLTRAEAIAGWCYLPFYLVLLSLGIQYIAALLGLQLSVMTINIIYFSVNVLFVLLVFRRFLLQRFFGSGFWNFVQTIILGFVLYYAGTTVIRLLAEYFAGDFVIYNNETVSGLVLSNRYVMLLVSVVLAPVVEETLVRGVVFGSIYPASRVLAYIVSILLFTLMHNWQYFGLHPFMSILLSCLPYIPASVALAWTYEKGGTIWAPITLHAIINAMSFGLLTLS